MFSIVRQKVASGEADTLESMGDIGKRGSEVFARMVRFEGWSREGNRPMLLDVLVRKLE